MTENDCRNAPTLSELFLRRTRVSAERVAYEYETVSGWTPASWTEYGELVRETSEGLAALGMAFGDRVAVWGDTMPEWTVVDLAAMALGGCTAGIYQTNTPDQAAYIINDSAATVVVVDGPGRLAQALAIRHQTPTVRFYITWGGGTGPDVHTLDEVRRRGRTYREDNPSAYEDTIARIQPDDVAVLVYTSGTTGPPKGAMLTHANCLFCARGVLQRVPLEPDDANIAFLPLSHVAEHVCSFYVRLYAGSMAYYMPELSRFGEVARTKSPTTVMAVPRLYEKAYAAIMERASNAPPRTKKIFDWALLQGGRAADLRLAGKPIPPGLAFKLKLADKLVFVKLRNVFGGRIKMFGSGAAPISADIVRFFHAVGMPFYEAYGMTECTGISHINSNGQCRIGSVGTLLDGFECQIAPDGEILLRGGGVFKGYLNQPEATAEAIDADGWLHTGDIGELDADGFLKITDRKKNLIITAGGKNVAPANSELLIKREPLISQVVVIGDRRHFLVALITLSADEIAKLASSNGFAGMTVAQIAASESVQARIQRAIDQANTELARYENIRKFVILEREFSIEDGEMTPTMKLKRKVIEETYRDRIEELYAS